MNVLCAYRYANLCRAAAVVPVIIVHLHFAVTTVDRRVVISEYTTLEYHSSNEIFFKSVSTEHVNVNHMCRGVTTHYNIIFVPRGKRSLRWP